MAALGPWLVDRYQALGIVGHLPKDFTPINTFKSHEIQFKNRIRNCEDILLDENLALAVLSCDAGRDQWNTVMGTFRPHENLANGRLYLYDYAKTGSKEEKKLRQLTFVNFPNENDFHPLGIELDPETSTLYAVSHAQAGSCIEIFQLSIKAATLTHVQTFRHPLIHAPNSIRSLGNSKLYVTNDHMFRARVSPLLAKVETFSGLPGGTVVYTDTQRPETTKIVARVPFANGIAELNSTTFAVASSSKAGVYLYEVQADHNLKFKSWFRTQAAVDNLSVDSDGTLLLSGHASALALMKVSKGRGTCDPNSDIQKEREACQCTAPSWAAQWTEKDGLKTLYKGKDFCSSTTMVRDVKRGVAMISGLYENGIMVIKE